MGGFTSGLRVVKEEDVVKGCHDGWMVGWLIESDEPILSILVGQV